MLQLTDRLLTSLQKIRFLLVDYISWQNMESEDILYLLVDLSMFLAGKYDTLFKELRSNLPPPTTTSLQIALMD